MEIFENFLQYLRLVTVTDVIDILIVAALLYKLIKFMRNTSTAKLLKGILFLLIAMQLSDWFKLHVVNYILTNMMQIGILAIVIIFQPELRKVLERFGSSDRRFFKSKKEESEKLNTVIEQTVRAAGTLSRSKTGALIVFEKFDNINSISKTGTIVDAEVSAELLGNIFYPKAPLHDGAVVVTGNRVHAAGCILPLSANLHISKELGTRHRAALGMSEAYDSPCVVVSEETGAISFACGGILKRHLAPETLERLLIKELMPQQSEEDGAKTGILAWLKGKKKK